MPASTRSLNTSADTLPQGSHVVVIGAGIIGTCTAWELLARGFRVTLVDPGDPGGKQAASYGNGAFLSPASVIPMSFPGMWKKIPGYLSDRNGALTIRWRYLPRLMPWLWRFLLAGFTQKKFRRTAGILRTLLADAPARHLRLAEATGQSDLIRQTGLIYAFANRAATAGEALSWQIRRENGVRMRDLERDELHQLIPDLSDHYTFGIMIEDGGHCTDPGAYVAGLASACEDRGARFVKASATGFTAADKRLTAVETTSGPIACDGAVIAAGVWSKQLAAQAGDRVSLESERGYHVEIADPGHGPDIPVMPQDGKMANIMTRRGLRASGQVELAQTSAPPDWHRADVLLGHLLRTYPALAAHQDTAKIHRWQGNRPSTPDGIPVIGPASGMRGVWYAFGHGHVGLASGPRTAALVADMLDGHVDQNIIAPFSARRFR